jgi:hypothetical protein
MYDNYANEINKKFNIFLHPQPIKLTNNTRTVGFNIMIGHNSSIKLCKPGAAYKTGSSVQRLQYTSMIRCEFIGECNGVTLYRFNHAL